VAGGDTASALAAGCPVVFKPHPAHPRTAGLAAEALRRATRTLGLPAGVFSVVEGEHPEVGLGLVRHPLTQAVAFTGSLRAGRALWAASAARSAPIPVYAEMGSVNPLWLLPSALDRHAERLADAFAASMTLGTGQFCTKPGVVVARQSDALSRFLFLLADRLQAVPPARMLSPALGAAFRSCVSAAAARPGVEVIVSPHGGIADGEAWTLPVVLRTSVRALLSDACLLDEMFGPACLVAVAENDAELEGLARHLPGQLTATVHGDQADLAARPAFLRELQRRVGRLVFNGFPTGLEVCPSIHHGGPYPATTDPRTTSVGTAAIHRFVRPICFQDCPETLLPVELQDPNPRRIWRLIDGRLTRDAIGRRPGPPPGP
jgi:NADP-dependent aldehyde dehydrogenase